MTCEKLQQTNICMKMDDIFDARGGCGGGRGGASIHFGLSMH